MSTTSDVAESQLATLRQERDEARAEVRRLQLLRADWHGAKVKAEQTADRFRINLREAYTSNIRELDEQFRLCCLVEQLWVSLETASAALDVVRNNGDRLDRSLEREGAVRAELEALRRERDAWQDKACKLENELVALQRLEAHVYGPQGRELAALRAAVQRVRVDLKRCDAEIFCAALDSLLALVPQEPVAKEGK